MNLYLLKKKTEPLSLHGEEKGGSSSGSCDYLTQVDLQINHIHHQNVLIMKKIPNDKAFCVNVAGSQG